MYSSYLIKLRYRNLTYFITTKIETLMKDLRKTNKGEGNTSQVGTFNARVIEHLPTESFDKYLLQYYIENSKLLKPILRKALEPKIDNYFPPLETQIIVWYRWNQICGLEIDKGQFVRARKFAKDNSNRNLILVCDFANSNVAWKNYTKILMDNIYEGNHGSSVSNINAIPLIKSKKPVLRFVKLPRASVTTSINIESPILAGGNEYAYQHQLGGFESLAEVAMLPYTQPVIDLFNNNKQVNLKVYLRDFSGRSVENVYFEAYQSDSGVGPKSGTRISGK